MKFFSGYILSLSFELLVEKFLFNFGHFFLFVARISIVNNELKLVKKDAKILPDASN
jgi:hypothetical protein